MKRPSFWRMLLFSIRSYYYDFLFWLANLGLYDWYRAYYKDEAFAEIYCKYANQFPEFLEVTR